MRARNRFAFAAVILIVAAIACTAAKDLASAALRTRALGLESEREPNDSFASAQTIGPSTVVRANVPSVGDVDLYAFSADAGDRVFAAMVTNFSASAQDGVLEVLRPDGGLVERDDDNGSFGPTAPSLAGVPIPEQGQYFLRASGKNGLLRPYALYFKLQSLPPLVEHEVFNDLVYGQPVPGGHWVMGTLSAPSDFDAYSVNLNAGDVVFASLDTDPDRDGGDQVAYLGFLTSTGFLPAAVDQGEPGPDSQALFVTVRTSGTYLFGVGAGSGLRYSLSLAVFPSANPKNCVTYSSADVPKIIPDGGQARVASTLTVPGSARIADLDVNLEVAAQDSQRLVFQLVAPGGNSVGLAAGVGSVSVPRVQFTLDDEAAPGAGALLENMAFTAGPDFRLSWLDGQNAGGVWTLNVDNLNASAGGELLDWSLRVCEARPRCLGQTNPIFSTDFESGAASFSSSGAGNEWELGLPSVAPLVSCNSGVGCFKTDLDGRYEASSAQELISPVIDLSTAASPVKLTWAMNYQLGTADLDHAYVEVREAGGSARVRRVWEFLDARMTTPIWNTTLQESAGWGSHVFDVSEFAGSNIQIVFHLDADPASSPSQASRLMMCPWCRAHQPVETGSCSRARAATMVTSTDKRGLAVRPRVSFFLPQRPVARQWGHATLRKCAPEHQRCVRWT